MGGVYIFKIIVFVFGILEFIWGDMINLYEIIERERDEEVGFVLDFKRERILVKREVKRC